MLNSSEQTSLDGAPSSTTLTLSQLQAMLSQEATSNDHLKRLNPVRSLIFRNSTTSRGSLEKKLQVGWHQKLPGSSRQAICAQVSSKSRVAQSGNCSYILTSRVKIRPPPTDLQDGRSDLKVALGQIVNLQSQITDSTELKRLWERRAHSRGTNLEIANKELRRSRMLPELSQKQSQDLRVEVMRLQTEVQKFRTDVQEQKKVVEKQNKAMEAAEVIRSEMETELAALRGLKRRCLTLTSDMNKEYGFQ